MPVRQVVCLCGSTRFWREIAEADLHETLAGRIVLSIAGGGSDEALFRDLTDEARRKLFAELAALHRDKIAMADSVVIVNVDDYVGPSTAEELRFARELGKPIRWWVWPTRHSCASEMPAR